MAPVLLPEAVSQGEAFFADHIGAFDPLEMPRQSGSAQSQCSRRQLQEAYRRDRSARAIFAGSDPDWQASVFGADPYPTGLAANRKMLEAAADQSNQEGLTRQPVNPDELFHESVRGT